jgi:hypothetical protein
LDEVRQLASEYTLTQPRTVNPHLHFREGDVAYWYRKLLAEADLRLQFESRRLALDRAEQTREFIATQGDLSAKAELIHPQLRIQ